MAEGVKIRVSSDSSKAQRDLQSLERNVAGLRNTADRVTKTFNRLAIGITAAFTGSAFQRGINRATDSVIELENRVALVTGRNDQLQKSLKSLYGLAAASRQPVAVAADTFNRFGLALSDAGVSSDALLVATEAVQKAATISGASAQTASMSIMQLGQGLASGELRGQELNSVLEGIPRLARAIAQGMGIPFGTLRAQAKAGKLTTDAVFAAILDQAESIEKDFGGLQATTSGLAAVFRDEFSRAIAVLDRDLLGFAKRFQELIEIGTIVLRSFADNFPMFMTKIRSSFLTFRLKFTAGLRDIEDAIEDTFGINISFKSFIDAIKDAFAKAFDVVDTYIIDPIQKGIEKASKVITWDKLVANFRAGLERIRTVFKGVSADDYPDAFQAFGDQITSGGLLDYMPSLNGITDQFNKFKDKVIKIFTALYNRLFGGSLFSGMFDQNHAEGSLTVLDPTPVGAKLSLVTGKFTEFKNDVIGVFQEIFNKVSELWSNTISFVGDKFSSMGQKNEGYSVEAQGSEDQLSQLQKIGTTIAGLFSKPIQVFNRITTLANGYNAELGENVGILNRINSALKATKTVFAEIMPTFEQTKEFAANLGKQSKSMLDRAFSVFDRSSEDGYAEAAFGDQIEGKDIFKNISEVGKSFTNALGYGLDTVFASLAIVFGSAIVFGVAGTVKKIGGPLAIFGLAEAGVLDEVVASLGRGIGNLISLALPNFDEETTDNTKSAIAYTGDVLRSLGGGVLEGLNLEGSDFAKSVVGVFTAGLIGAIISPTVRAMMVGLFKFAFIGMPFTKNLKGRKSLFGMAGQLGFAGLTSLPGLFGMGGPKANKQINPSMPYADLERNKFGFPKGAFNNATALQNTAKIGTKAGIAATFLRAGPAVLGGPFGLFSLALTSALIYGVEAFAAGLKDDKEGFADQVADALTPGEEFKERLTEAFVPSEGLKARASEFFGWWGSRAQALRDILSAPYKAEMRENFKENELRMGKASGGYISGAGTATSDSIPAMLSNGEFVVRASAVKKYGRGFFAAANSGILTGFAPGTETMSQIRSNDIGKVFAELITREIDKLNRSNRDALRTVERNAKNNSELLIAGLNRLIANQEFAMDNASTKELRISAGQQLESLRRIAKDTKDLIAPRLEANVRDNQEVIDNLIDINNNTKDGEGGGSGTNKKRLRKEDKEFGEQMADNFTGDIKTAFSNAFKTGNFKDFFSSILNTLTSQIIDTFVETLVDGMFGKGETNFFKGLFSEMSAFGNQVGTAVKGGIVAGASKGQDGEGGGFISGILKFFKGLGSSLMEGISSIFSGITSIFGGGGFPGAVTTSAMPLARPFNKGGYVPSIGGQRGIDSVPAMLTPGELVVPTNKVGEFTSGKQQTIFNLNITGDVSRQTRSEIVKMLPEITNGVNFVNKENNYRGQ